MKKILFTFLSLALLATSLQAKETQAYEASMKVKATNGKTYTFNGTKDGIQIQGMEGKVVILEFFGHRCPPCLKMIPNLIETQNKFKGKAEVFAIEVQGFNNAKLSNFMKQKNINYTAAAYQESGNSEIVKYVSERAQWSGSIPFMLALDGKGNVQYIHTGMLGKAQLEDLINQIAAGKLQ